MGLFSGMPGPEPVGTAMGLQPLAERMRPRTLDEFIGQEKLLGPGKPLRVQIENDNLSSMLFWGPPGCGKTTLARVIARLTKAEFVSFSAVLSGIKEIKEVMAVAEHKSRGGARTIVFVDEVHRFNKAQQDAFLPHVEAGHILFIGATTENPSFEVISPLLSRTKVYVLEALTTPEIVELLRRALEDSERGLGGEKISLDGLDVPDGGREVESLPRSLHSEPHPSRLRASKARLSGRDDRVSETQEKSPPSHTALREHSGQGSGAPGERKNPRAQSHRGSGQSGVTVPQSGTQNTRQSQDPHTEAAYGAPDVQEGEMLWRIAAFANGDARTAYNTLELCVRSAKTDTEGVKRITAELLGDVLQRKMLRYDKAGEEHFNLISALHKSVRNSDPDAALYWLARMIESGEEPLYLARRMVRMASEDIGMAEPGALAVTLAAKEAFDFLGAPEGYLALAQAAVYLSLAPKSDALYAGYGAALEDVRKTEADPVPLHLRNAVTGLMKNVGYGEGYKYAHDFEERVTDMTCLPENLSGRVYYKPTEQGFEARLRLRMEEIRKLRVREAGR
jgi:putative ATPase